jgi:hypothetical protein
VIERALGLDVLAGPADGAGDLGLPIDLLQSARHLDVVVGTGQAARRLQEQVGPGLGLLALPLVVLGRHAGADHLVDVLLEILRGV